MPFIPRSGNIWRRSTCWGGRCDTQGHSSKVKAKNGWIWSSALDPGWGWRFGVIGTPRVDEVTVGCVEKSTRKPLSERRAEDALTKEVEEGWRLRTKLGDHVTEVKRRRWRKEGVVSSIECRETLEMNQIWC